MKGAFMKNRLFLLMAIVLGLTLITSAVFAAELIIVPGWSQVNVDGFGDSRNTIQALEIFNGSLYAGTWSREDGFSAQIWRTSDGHNWTQVPWLNENNGVVWDLIVFHNQLYAGTASYDGGEIWRTSDGVTWEKVAAGGFGDPENSSRTLAVYSDTLFVATDNRTTGIEVWRSDTGNTDSWTQANIDGFGGGATTQDVTIEVFDEYVYVGFGRIIDDTYTAELWRSNDGYTWAPVFINGAGDVNNSNVTAMEGYDGYFYIGIRNVNSGGEVWRSPNGTDWTVVFDGGNGDPDNQRPYGLISFNGCLYLVMNNSSSGAEVWESNDGLTWRVIANNGWGDSNNRYADYVDNGHAIFNGGLYIGTVNTDDGGEIWAYQMPRNFLPLIVR
jgi:hypothetical protein